LGIVHLNLVTLVADHHRIVVYLGLLPELLVSPHPEVPPGAYIQGRGATPDIVTSWNGLVLMGNNATGPSGGARRLGSGQYRRGFYCVAPRTRPLGCC